MPTKFAPIAFAHGVKKATEWVAVAFLSGSRGELQGESYRVIMRLSIPFAPHSYVQRIMGGVEHLLIVVTRETPHATDSVSAMNCRLLRWR